MDFAPSEPLQTAIEAAQAAGEIILSYFAAGVAATNKTVDRESQGLVTEADLQAEQEIIRTIQDRFPGHCFLAEESGGRDRSADHLWVIDPLDGTNNFAHGIPFFAVSIAYLEQQETRCGVIYNPLSGDLFVAEKGRGAFQNSRRVSVNQHQHLHKTMIAVGFYYDRGDMMRRTLRTIESLFENQVHGIRRMGAASLDLVQVGLGCFGGYFEYTLSPWDFAAAKLFVEEAGGMVTTCAGQPLELKKSSVLASNKLLHQELLNIVNR